LEILWPIPCQRAKDSTPWARDNILFAGGMVFLPVIAVWIHDRNHSIDWDIVKTTFWLYLGAFGLYAAWHAVRTPWKLSLDAPASEGQPTPDFKTEIHDLAVEILDFVYARIKDAPPKPDYTPSFGADVDVAAIYREMGQKAAWQAVFDKYESETLGIYKYKYSRRVAILIKSLPGAGIDAGWLQEHGATPLNSDSIRAVGDYLMQAADLLLKPENRNTKTFDGA